jgi:hypothetical protein
MGNRRLGRKRLFSLEKKGQKVELGSGPGIADAVLYATQHRQGHEIITEIAIDLGVGSIISSGNIDLPGKSAWWCWQRERANNARTFYFKGANASAEFTAE